METWRVPEGEMTAVDEGSAVRFRVFCHSPCEPARLLRCYGVGAERDLLVGVLEPRNGRLTLERRLSWETLRQAGCKAVPTEYYLSDGGARERVPEEAPQAEEREAEAAEKAPEKEAQEAADHAGQWKGEAACKAIRTGDELMDAAIASGAVQAEEIPEGVRLHCPFSSGQAFPLAFAAVLCRIEGETAILDWKKKASPEGD